VKRACRGFYERDGDHATSLQILQFAGLVGIA
jgi:hypothetical protein